MNTIEIRPVHTPQDRNTFLAFPWRIYRNDPLWVPPLLPERRKVIDPDRGKFFQDGYADLFIAWRGSEPVGTICCAEDCTATESRGFGECLIGFFECLEEYTVAQALFKAAVTWAQEHSLTRIRGTFNLDREDSRGILIEGRDRPPAIYCGHNPPYYASYFERFGFTKFAGDSLAYAIDLDLQAKPIHRLLL